jgi:hypothetical protein
VTAVAVCAYNALVVLGIGYVVFWRGQSGWWFALALILMMQSSSREDKE